MLHKYARDLQKNAGLVLVFRGFVKDFWFVLGILYLFLVYNYS